MTDISCVSQYTANLCLNLCLQLWWWFRNDPGRRRCRDIDYNGILTPVRLRRLLVASFWINVLPCPCRIAISVSHVPWLGAIILSYPVLVPDFKAFRIYSRERAMRRIKDGSPHKDLFHHLVRYIFYLQMIPSGSDN